jgi:hypothetical protein
MALVPGGFGMTVSFLDNGMNQVTREYIMDLDIATYEDAAAAAAAMIPKVVAVTDASLPQYRVFQIFSENALTIPASGVQVEDQASITALLTTPGNKQANINIPAPKPAIFVATSGKQANIVNTANAALVTFTDSFKIVGSFTISDGEEITRLVDGKRVHKKSNRG